MRNAHLGPNRRAAAVGSVDAYLPNPYAELPDASEGRSPWVTADTVANHLGVDISYVYDHAVELGARRLGAGPRARLRFRLDQVDHVLVPVSDRADKRVTPPPTAKHKRRRVPPTQAPLLPIRHRPWLNR